MTVLQRNNLILILLFSSVSFYAQVANYIVNGSFEEMYNCTFPYDPRKLKNWLSTDSSISFCGMFFSTCNSKVPLNGNTYQFPRTGETYIISTLYDLNSIGAGRGYLKNRLKENLQAGTTYCVKFFVNISNQSPRGMNGFGIYFGDNTIDTITKCNVPLTYLNPQVKNPLNNIIADTLNWVPITGTFVANGTEKFALIGNFLANNAVITSPINTPYYPQTWTDVLVDDVSCIEVDLPAYAGPDKQIYVGESTFIGREPDFAIDKSCIWYQLPNTTAMDTISGLWVAPLVTTTYVVRQEVDCGSVKWDTVVVEVSNDFVDVGVENLNKLSENIKLFPNPTSGNLNLVVSGVQPGNLKEFSIISAFGQVVREEEIKLTGDHSILKTDDLVNGIYFLELNFMNSGTVRKRFVVAKNQ